MQKQSDIQAEILPLPGSDFHVQGFPCLGPISITGICRLYNRSQTVPQTITFLEILLLSEAFGRLPNGNEVEKLSILNAPHTIISDTAPPVIIPPRKTVDLDFRYEFSFENGVMMPAGCCVLRADSLGGFYEGNVKYELRASYRCSGIPGIVKSVIKFPRFDPDPLNIYYFGQAQKTITGKTAKEEVKYTIEIPRLVIPGEQFNFGVSIHSSVGDVYSVTFEIIENLAIAGALHGPDGDKIIMIMSKSPAIGSSPTFELQTPITCPVWSTTPYAADGGAVISPDVECGTVAITHKLKIRIDAAHVSPIELCYPVKVLPVDRPLLENLVKNLSTVSSRIDRKVGELIAALRRGGTSVLDRPLLPVIATPVKDRTRSSEHLASGLAKTPTPPTIEYIQYDRPKSRGARSRERGKSDVSATSANSHLDVLPPPRRSVSPAPVGDEDYSAGRARGVSMGSAALSPPPRGSGTSVPPVALNAGLDEEEALRRALKESEDEAKRKSISGGTLEVYAASSGQHLVAPPRDANKSKVKSKPISNEDDDEIGEVQAGASVKRGPGILTIIENTFAPKKTGSETDTPPLTPKTAQSTTNPLSATPPPRSTPPANNLPVEGFGGESEIMVQKKPRGRNAAAAAAAAGPGPSPSPRSPSSGLTAPSPHPVPSPRSPSSDPHGKPPPRQRPQFKPRVQSAANAQVRDSNERRVCVLDYDPLEPGEIRLRRGDNVMVYQVPVIGIAHGFNESTGELGRFPIAALAPPEKS